jgi:hypothetical protein
LVGHGSIGGSVKGRLTKIQWNDQYRADKEVDVDPLAAPAPGGAGAAKAKGKEAKSAYAMLEEFEAGGGEDNDDEENGGGGGGGGLMVSSWRTDTIRRFLVH